jgi:hypothetical protein
MAIVDDFKSAVDAFNQRQWDVLRTFLDDYVVAFTVHGVHPVIGRDAVIQYLQNDVSAEHPKFHLIGDPQANGATVYGKACWTDPIAVEVIYHFTLRLSRALGKFVIKTAYAPEDGTPCPPDLVERVR